MLTRIILVILYMSEIAPKKVRDALVAGYQFCITMYVTYLLIQALRTGPFHTVQDTWNLYLGLFLDSSNIQLH